MQYPGHSWTNYYLRSINIREYRQNDLLAKTQMGLGVLDVSNGAKEELINYAAKSSAAVNELKYVKAIKVASKGLFGAQATISLYQTYDALKRDDANKWGVTAKAGLDVTIGYISLVGGPVGWGVGAVYFLGDAAGLWGDWGQAANRPAMNLIQKGEDR